MFSHVACTALNSERLHGDKNGILFNERSGARETINSRTDSFVGIMAENPSSSCS